MPNMILIKAEDGGNLKNNDILINIDNVTWIEIQDRSLRLNGRPDMSIFFKDEVTAQKYFTHILTSFTVHNMEEK
jgi:hypothetical protein